MSQEKQTAEEIGKKLVEMSNDVLQQLKDLNLKRDLLKKHCFKLDNLGGFTTEVTEAMEEYATLKLQEQAKEIERLKGENEKTLFDFAFKVLDKKLTTNEVNNIVNNFITNH